jgi:F0F1-type ATP synthase membrane subunit c/vacuolar-type H+-ATPase subunit K
MDTALRQLQIIWIALLITVGVYIVIGERVHPQQAPPNKIVFQAVALACVATMSFIFIVRRFTIGKAVEVLSINPEDAGALGRWRVGYIVSLALSESVALFGFVLRMLGFSLGQVAPFYLAAGILMLFCMPRRPPQFAS